MATPLVAHASIRVNAPRATVWDALIDPEQIKRYFFGTTVVTDWTVGSPIIWQGEWQGSAYEDKGVIQAVEPERLLEYTHFSPLSGQPDLPENYHTITIELTDDGAATVVALAQDNNGSETEREHSEANWNMVLASLKRLLEA
jgi:uncharacterized protein YndB with AHSA1/START domain